VLEAAIRDWILTPEVERRRVTKVAVAKAAAIVLADLVHHGEDETEGSEAPASDCAASTAQPGAPTRPARRPAKRRTRTAQVPPAAKAKLGKR
jgi:hypothetical protein